MKAPFLVLPLLLISGLLFSQPQTNYTENDLRDLSNLGPNSPGIRTIDLTYEGIKGTTFLSEDWQKGAFQLKDKEAFSQDIHIMIDLVKNLVYYRLNNGFIGSLSPTKLDAIRLNTGEDQYRVFRVYPEAKVEGSNTKQVKFYEELYSGSFTLLKHHYKLFREANYKSAYATGKPYDEYFDQNSLWLQEKGQAFHKVKIKKKAIVNALPSYGAQVQKTLKSKKLPLQSEEDLIQLLETLQAEN